MNSIACTFEGLGKLISTNMVGTAAVMSNKTMETWREGWGAPKH